MFDRFRTVLALVVSVGCMAPATLFAQSAGNGFLFGAPAASFTLRAGYAAAAARGDLIDFTTTNLTLDHRDFSSPALDADLGIWLAPKTQLQLSLGYAGVNRSSEFRDYLDQNNLPIPQTTTFQRVPLSVSVKQYITAPGHTVGSLAWIPSKLSPYVGAGAGAMWYRFRQTGEFVDFQTNDIFQSVLESAGWSPMAQALAGVDYSVGPRYALNAEASYQWARAQLSNDFSGFGRLDLSGLSTTVGFTVRF